MMPRIVLLIATLARTGYAIAEDCPTDSNYCFSGKFVYAIAASQITTLTDASGHTYLFRSLAKKSPAASGAGEIPIDDADTDLVWRRTSNINLKTLNFGSGETSKDEIKPWDAAYRELLSPSPIILSDIAVKPRLIEPDISYLNRRFEKRAAKLESRRNSSKQAGASGARASGALAAQTEATIVDYPSKVWPSRETGWHRDDGYTGLAEAIKAIADVGDASRVTIAHLDTGYDPNDSFIPTFFDQKRSRDFTSGGCDTPYTGESKDKPTHGARTLSTLAGGKARIDNGDDNYFDFIGSNPYARVISYKIAKNSVVHFWPSEMSAAIGCAADSGVDVITISAGGFPSLAQRTAVNKAYSQGVAMFAATGDFFVFPFTGFTITPSTVAFPARYNRVIGVAGITEKKKSYGKAPCYFCLLKFWQWGDTLLSWSMRGSYGPASVMKDSAVAAYAPNVLHSSPSNSTNNAVALDGSGTSHSTPQVAAAAALWLQLNRPEIEGVGAWNDWQKTESVYQALFESGYRPDQYSVKHMGEGVVDAKKLINTKFGTLEIEERAEATIGVRWIWDLIDSWNLGKLLFNLIPGFENLDDPRLKKLSDSVEEMIATEIQQVIFESKSAQKSLDKHVNCASSRAQNQSDCEKTVSDQLKNEIIDSDVASEFLKSVIREDLNTWGETHLKTASGHSTT